MTVPSLASELVDLITDEIAIDGGPVAADTDLLLGGVVDSLGVVRIVNWMEERLGVEIDASDVTLENFQTVAAMVRYAERRRDAAA